MTSAAADVNAILGSVKIVENATASRTRLRQALLRHPLVVGASSLVIVAVGEVADGDGAGRPARARRRRSEFGAPGSSLRLRLEVCDRHGGVWIAAVAVTVDQHFDR